MNIKIKKLHPEAIIPTYATDGAGCFDLYALIPEKSDLVMPGRPLTIRTGLAFEIPKGQVLVIYSRSGHGFKNDVRLANCVGLCDADYRGEVMVKLTNDNNEGNSMVVNHGDRIAQAKLEPAEQVTFTEVDELSETARGDNGFGSTGA